MPTLDNPPGFANCAAVASERLTATNEWEDLLYPPTTSPTLEFLVAPETPDLNGGPYMDRIVGDPDYDRDGLSNGEDNCPLAADADQEDAPATVPVQDLRSASAARRSSAMIGHCAPWPGIGTLAGAFRVRMHYRGPSG